MQTGVFIPKSERPQSGTHSLVQEILSNIKTEPDDSELELQIALKKARRLKLQEAVAESKNSIEKVAESVLERNSEGNAEGGSIVLNATAEFCRTLGDIPTYGLAGNRDEDAQELLLMKQMSSTDTPLGTLSLLQQKQKETQSPFVVLSGSKQT
ncbi:U4/U6.U5 tri-snRNP-associated protein 1-like [Cryptotermes secundus]|uniref:U4/U6.U5 tri-snRNP-associated protein 1-like n=1 Tax=Cryptotermes secundus TaxID=105785 RepID=UPI000CD7CDE7|nr:U4/U6.U5 tri-snRNP-associated protein 1-like [Cryptotermes secundus]XP_023712793.1 U4/U6.U5 tri-snRNP-associated protein 1-like [Cryptotermes secundus]XP_023712794.1 U4/U6.U5 tri-snRNP-associated protein 1-like [Cryptotermes secundus]XP_023712795.1 U4/U6.U5 tri-snRNP-associated protein 1-like [Cryptotermes secundus]XP_033608515.1 U4/U6.U5 tri-snRNP-associated protein 1-like [Cryptotermes secundus]